MEFRYYVSLMHQLSIAQCYVIRNHGFDKVEFSGTHKEMLSEYGKREVYLILNVYLLINLIKS